MPPAAAGRQASNQVPPKGGLGLEGSWSSRGLGLAVPVGAIGGLEPLRGPR
jgi:hypothetical protein